MYNNAEFGLFIKEKRKSLNYSREYFAEQCDVSDRCIANIERGTSEPKLGTVLEICHSCGIDIGELAKFRINKETKDM